MSGIEVRNLHKRWSTFDAVKDASFTVAPGTLTVLLGPSGCGKSTTLRLIAGLDAATSGQILIGGKDVTAAPPARRGLAISLALSLPDSPYRTHVVTATYAVVLFTIAVQGLTIMPLVHRAVAASGEPSPPPGDSAAR